MQITFNPQITNAFKGSFKFQDLEALIADFEIKDENTKPVVKREEKKIEHALSIAKKFNVFSNREITKVKMWSSSDWSINNHLPTQIKNICKTQHVYPSSDLFAIQGLNDENKRYVLFNTHFKDDNTGLNCTQVFYLESSDENYTQTQKNVFKLMRDSQNKRYLINTSSYNPFAKFSHGANGNTDFGPVINAMADLSRTADSNDMMDEKNEFRQIIYSADGEYCRYKHFTLYIKPKEQTEETEAK